MQEDTTVLVLMSPQRRAFALERLDACRANVLLAGDVTEACRLLGRRPVDVVLTDGDLPDGGWQCIMDSLEREDARASVVVSTTALDSRRCAEVYKRGVYDLLLEPYSREELTRVLEGAASRTYMRRLRPAS